MKYTQFDKDLCDDVSFVFVNGTSKSGAAGAKLEFQFPPKITTDSRKADWKETNQVNGTEPLPIWQSSGPREMSMSLTYIVDGHLWPITRIQKQVRLLRGYFARIKDKGNYRNLVILLRLWGIGGEDDMSFRIKGVDVKLSETLVSGPGEIKNTYPLRTDITLDLRLWTTGGPPAEPTQELPKLAREQTADWY